MPKVAGTRAFTIIEVLVCCLIIVALAALVYAAIGGVRSSALIGTCTNNMGQIGKAVALYASDRDDFVPPMMTAPITTQDAVTQKPVPVQGNAETWRSMLMGYVREPSVFFCPADAHARQAQERLTSDGMRSNEFTSYATVFTTGYRVTFGGFPMGQLGDFPPERVYARDVVLRKIGAGTDYPFETAHGTRITELRFDGGASSIPLK